MEQRNDIEDVLSSIRRLVAEEGKGPGRAEAPVAKQPTPPLPALMLDATRRVVDPEDPFQTVPVPPQPVAARRAPADGRPERRPSPTGPDVFAFQRNLLSTLRDPRPEDAEPEEVELEAEEMDFESPIEAAMRRPAPSSAPDRVDAPTAGARAPADGPRLGMIDATGPDARRPGDVSASVPALARDDGPVDLADLSQALGSDEALRDLIAEIVRQELAGALGERITRNVRKLVRRELRQMMSGDEFD